MERELAGLAEALPDGRLVTGAASLEAYRRDRAGLSTAGVPLAAVRARTVADVSAALAWAHERRVPVVPRGAGTGLSGGADTPDGALVVSLADMTAIREIDPADQVAVVEAGVVNAEVSRAAAEFGLFYPPDPSSFEISTIGGNLATNAGGLRCVKYGVTRDSVLGLEAVLADGRVLRTGGRTVKGVAGYDLTRLLVGSEGTLGVITSAVLRLRPRPRGGPATFAAEFPTLEAAGAAVSGIVRVARPSLLELLDNMSINLVEDHARMDLDRAAEALVLGQADGPNAAEELAAMVAVCRDAGAASVVETDDPADAELMLGARRKHYEACEARGVPLVDDVAVPRSRIAEMLREIDRVGRESGLLVSTVGHAGDGNLHPTFILRRDAVAEEEPRAWAAAEEICRVALSMGGTVTGEHGVGALKREWVREELGGVGLEVHRAVKAALDPRGILNPGKAF
ncbi:FAD-binding oxidoreductase [Mangrovactinospora gilvigrisea]|uniref:FAD-binding oxidoreductase n=1 Tax=Mangrovactinospora gilvigrisea TaxID=1428644 RepID=A0A1J7C3E8_9ACTN|nr:FAD-linked oxidase C-terminal domain-containing protein [Mangrovactinospora gilvigrisea]OIV36076.1 FAD-binding oxidoreductase [Mangrovactinospora gilvigrisea]